PHVVGVDEVGLECVDGSPQVTGPGALIGGELILIEGRETSAWVRHDIAHPWHREFEWLPAEDQRVDPFSAKASDLRMGVVQRYTDYRALIVTRSGRVADDGIEGDPATGQGWSLREGV
ncbi:MAG: hypothetical protein P8127_16965, partial [Acidobacteriota bacterium]